MGSPDTGAREPLDNEGVLWVAALDRVPIEERIEWVATMKRRVDALNAQRALAAGVGVPPDKDSVSAPAKERQDAQEHRLEIVSRFLYDGYVCECSCGWRSGEMATQDAALEKGRAHALAGVGEARPAEPPQTKTVEMPIAMRGPAVYWRTKDSGGAPAEEQPDAREPGQPQTDDDWVSELNYDELRAWADKFVEVLEHESSADTLVPTKRTLALARHVVALTGDLLKSQAECGQLREQIDAAYRETGEYRRMWEETLRERDALLQQGIEAFRLTREYVGERALPEIEGWSWFDWCVAARAALGDVAAGADPESSDG